MGCKSLTIRRQNIRAKTASGVCGFANWLGNPVSEMEWPTSNKPYDFRDFVSKVADAYVRSGTPENDDPLDDFRLIEKAFQHPSFSERNLAKFSENISPPQRAHGEIFQEWIARYFGHCANILAPGWSADEWSSLFAEVMVTKYGGQRVRIKSRPAEAVKHAAGRLTPSQLMEQFGISRSYAYRLCKQRVKK